MPKILITGSGSLASELIRQMHKTASRLVVYSRNESRQAELRKVYPEGGEKGLRYFIGDIRDIDRLTTAMHGIDQVIHTAALKHVDVGEYNPEEFIKTNIIGSLNVAKACNLAGVKRCIMASTDKAVNPINLYGMTKGCAEKALIGYNNLGPCRFAVCRYGNVEGSRGSVLPIWQKQIQVLGYITITDKRMTRFWIKLEESAKFIQLCLNIMKGGEIFLPIIGSSKITDRVPLNCSDIRETGIRPGEKLHESLLNEEEARNCYYRKKKGVNFYCIYPSFHDWKKDIKKEGEKVDEKFSYKSNIFM